jgi:pSer/pThr/pTyr-binding forkhead associated (FHA) protein/ribosomal protein L40E
MITCPNCNHPNPESATQCEACYTALPSTTSCPNCGAEVQTDATFCGQCGFNLEPQTASTPEEEKIPATVVSNPLASPVPEPETSPTPEIPPTVTSPPPEVSEPKPTPPSAEVAEAEITPPPESSSPASPVSSSTQLQVQNASLFHIQTNTKIELSPDLNVIHIGKPNEQIPPDIDVSGFPDSGIVSRIHADIRVEGDTYFLEDVGSSNGTYVNHIPLPPGNRHRLRAGDRIALGKGDLVTFIFQMS